MSTSPAVGIARNQPIARRDDDHEPPPPLPPKPREVPAARLERWIQNTNTPTIASGDLLLDSSLRSSIAWQSAPPTPTPTAAPPSPACDFSAKHDFDGCGTERIANATLFVKGAGDVDEVDANDIRQNRLGDCHLLGPAVAMLQTVAGRARMREMIKEVVRDGKTVGYEVTFRVPVERTLGERVRGKPPYDDVKVEVSPDFVKGHVGTGDVAADGGGVEVWPLVLEAAYAKLQGGANKINGGVGTVGLSNLTGKKAEEKTLEKGLFKYSAWNLKRDIAANKPLCITFTRQGGNTAGNPAVPQFGAYGFHCYAVVGTFEKNGETYVQLKNPWGKQDPSPISLRDLEALKPQVSIGQRP